MSAAIVRMVNPIKLLLLICLVSFIQAAIVSDNNKDRNVQTRYRSVREPNSDRLSSSSKISKVLLVSFDGFRWDYLQKYKANTSWFHYLRDNGGSTLDGSMIGTFASFTFPSHFTIATGLYQESHGIVANNMYDPRNRQFFHSHSPASVRDPFWFQEATPIWIVAQMQGKPSGTFYWPGSETTYHNVCQKYRKFYDVSYPYEKRVDTVVQWLKEDIQFATLYFDQPDAAGHMGGPNSKLVENAVAKVNAVLGYLIEKMKMVGIYDSTNLIVLSDHGMAECTKERIIRLYEFIENRTDLYSKMVNFLGPVVDFIPQPGKTEQLYQFLKNLTITKQITNVTVYKKDTIPNRFHYRNNRRVQNVTVVADLGYYIAAKYVDIPIPAVFGAHGYDNAYPEMRPIFIAHGPDIKRTKVKPFRQVDVYNLLTHLLRIKSNPNNGSWENVSSLINHSKSIFTPSILCYIFSFSLWKFLMVLQNFFSNL